MSSKRDVRQNEIGVGTKVWLVLATDGAAVAFWEPAAAVAHQAALSAVDPGNPALVRQVVVQGRRRTCQLCGEPVVLDDIADSESWRHADEANDLGDHTAEV